MRVFSVDLGSELVGWAYMDGADLYSVGTWKLTSPRDQSAGIRWLVLTQRLDEVLTVSRLHIDLVAFEEVRRHLGTAAAHAYGGAKAHLLAWCERHGLEYLSVPVQDVKRAAVGRAVGKGTSKEDVLEAAKARWKRHRFDTDDAADAAFIGIAAQTALGKI